MVSRLGNLHMATGQNAGTVVNPKIADMAGCSSPPKNATATIGFGPVTISVSPKVCRSYYCRCLCHNLFLFLMSIAFFKKYISTLLSIYHFSSSSSSYIMYTCIYIYTGLTHWIGFKKKYRNVPIFQWSKPRFSREDFASISEMLFSEMSRSRRLLTCEFTKPSSAGEW